MKMPVPIIVPTEKAQHCQKPMTFAVGRATIVAAPVAPMSVMRVRP